MANSPPDGIIPNIPGIAIDEYAYIRYIGGRRKEQLQPTGRATGRRNEGVMDESKRLAAAAKTAEQLLVKLQEAHAKTTNPALEILLLQAIGDVVGMGQMLKRVQRHEG